MVISRGWRRWIGVAVIGLAAAACQPGEQLVLTSGDGGSPYNLFYTPKDHAQELMATARWAEVSTLYADQRSWFAARPEERAALSSAATALAADLDARAAAARRGLVAEATVDPASWTARADGLRAARKVLADIEGEVLVRDLGVGVPQGALLREDVEALVAALERQAAAALRAFDPLSDRDFFAAYPVSLDETAVLEAVLDDTLARLDSEGPDRVVLFLERYEDSLSAAAAARIADAVVDAVVAQEGGADGLNLREALSTTDRLAVLGLDVATLPGLSLAFADVTSQQLLDRGGIEFAAAVDLDLPIEVEGTTIEAGTAPGSGVDYLIVFDVALANADRRLTQSVGNRSEMIVGYREVPNPDWKSLQIDLTQAQQTLSMRQQQVFSTQMSQPAPQPGLAGALSGMASVLATAAARAEADEAQREVNTILEVMRGTPEYVEEAVMRPYEYRVANVEASKTMTVNYYLVDVARRTVFKGLFDVVERADYDLVFGVQPTDPRKAQIEERGWTEDEAIAWEQAPIAVPLSAIVEDYLAAPDALTRLASVDALFADIARTRQVAIDRADSERVTASVDRNDARWDSVVKVLNPQGSFGTGFYVASNMIMTNHHVIDGARFVEILRFDGTESFGRVIEADERLDLAVIRVEARGKPVEFYTNQDLKIGAEIEALGHPHGLDFTVTRGIVSAVRALESLSGIGEDVWFVQTDADINGGNSGGPLFLGQRVIGVNTWGATGGGGSSGSIGLNFAVHYKEVRDFLDRSMAMN